MNINLTLGCEDCRHANQWGTGCEYGLMFPIAVLMSGRDRCEKMQPKTTEQLEEQLRR